MCLNMFEREGLKMDILKTKGQELNKAFDDVVASLEDLERSIRRDAEDNALPRFKVDRALSSLTILKKTIGGESLGEEYRGPTRRVLQLVDEMNNPAKLTALGSLQTEFSGMLHTVYQLLYKDDSRRAKKVDLDPMRGR